MSYSRVDLPALDTQTLITRLKALAEPSRLGIFQLLMEGIHCNCELGDALEISPNLISHHLRVLREAGLVEMERDPDDARWIYYSIRRAALTDIHRVLGALFDPTRIKERRPVCGPQSNTLDLVDASRDV